MPNCPENNSEYNSENNPENNAESILESKLKSLEKDVCGACFFNAQIERISEQLKSGSSFGRILRDIVREEQNMSIAKATRLYRKAFFAYGDSAHDRFFGSAQPKEMSCRPEFGDQLHLEAAASIVLYNMQLRGILDRDIPSDRLIYHCLYKLDWCNRNSEDQKNLNGKPKRRCPYGLDLCSRKDENHVQR